jgi:YD repeat-containing protein
MHLILQSALQGPGRLRRRHELLLDLAAAGRTSYSYDQAGNRSRKDDPVLCAEILARTRLEIRAGIRPRLAP